MMAADLGKSIVGVVVAVLVIAVFLVRRVGGPGRAAPRFDPADYRDVPVLAPEEASRHVGDRARVCGEVVATNYARGVEGRPTFLNLGRPYPEQLFDVVIWGRYRENFSQPPELHYRETRICASGRVSEHQGVPRIEVRVPDQIRERSRRNRSRHRRGRPASRLRSDRLVRLGAGAAVGPALRAVGHRARTIE